MTTGIISRCLYRSEAWWKWLQAAFISHFIWSHVFSHCFFLVRVDIDVETRSGIWSVSWEYASPKPKPKIESEIKLTHGRKIRLTEQQRDFNQKSRIWIVSLWPGFLIMERIAERMLGMSTCLRHGVPEWEFRVLEFEITPISDMKTHTGSVQGSIQVLKVCVGSFGLTMYCI